MTFEYALMVTGDIDESRRWGDSWWSTQYLAFVDNREPVHEDEVFELSITLSLSSYPFLVIDSGAMSTVAG